MRKSPPKKTRKRTRFQKDTYFRVLRFLQKNSEMSQWKMAEAIGVSVGMIHYLLNDPIDKGLVELGNFTAAKDQCRYAYL